MIYYVTLSNGKRARICGSREGLSRWFLKRPKKIHKFVDNVDGLIRIYREPIKYYEKSYVKQGYKLCKRTEFGFKIIKKVLDKK